MIDAFGFLILGIILVFVGALVLAGLMMLVMALMAVIMAPFAAAARLKNNV